MNDQVILGVTASDAHAVANKLLAIHLREHGFGVVNLGVCTPLTEFAGAFRRHPGALAVAIGSVNGHACTDLADLPRLRAAGELGCPVIVGGNLAVGHRGGGQAVRRLSDLGVDAVLTDAGDLVPLLQLLRAGERADRADWADADWVDEVLR